MPTINELFSLAGRVAIVTGGSRGLGQEMAEGLGEAGCALMLCARRNEWLRPTVDAMRARGFRVEGMPCDVAKPPDVQAVVDKTVAVYGKVDILINNAGVTWAAEPEDLPFDKWQKVVDINLTGAFLFSQAAGRDMLTRQWGRIINIASIAGLHASVSGPHYAPYAATKAGLMGLTRSLARTREMTLRGRLIDPYEIVVLQAAHALLARIGRVLLFDPQSRPARPLCRRGDAIGPKSRGFPERTVT